MESGSYQIRPEKKFRSEWIQKEATRILSEYLLSKDYNPRETGKWSQDLTDLLLKKVTEGDGERYKFIVQLVICEERGSGWRISSRCLWDLDSDGLVTATFVSDSLTAIATIYAVFHY